MKIKDQIKERIEEIKEQKENHIKAMLSLPDPKEQNEKLMEFYSLGVASLVKEYNLLIAELIRINNKT